jgi:alpha-tubulin suppressor-like RCC1 family protein
MKKKFFHSIYSLFILIVFILPNSSCTKENPEVVGYAEIAAGGTHSLALKNEDGGMWAWGNNESGQLGDGTFEDKNSPVWISSGFQYLSYSAVAAGGDHSLATTGDGKLWAWGNNEYGQLGDGTNLNKNTIVQVDSGKVCTWSPNCFYYLIAAGDYHSIALKTDNTLWAWGRNDHGQLGDGTYVNKNAPVQIGSNYHFTPIAAGGSHSLVLQTDGTLWAWGKNDFGQLGNGSTVDKNIPSLVVGNFLYATIAAGGSHSFALKKDGTLWAWGRNDHGQLGDGTNIDRSLPVLIGPGFKKIAAGKAHSVALKTDGSLWAWGAFTGDSTIVNMNMPVKIGSGYDEIAAGGSHSFALQIDVTNIGGGSLFFGQLWGWGNNFFGQLGDNTNINQSMPLLIGPK